jgi:hypothetical protein
MTTLARLAGAAALAAVAALPAFAESSRAPVRVSVQVTRSCRVETHGEQVAVGCGKGSQAVQVTENGRTISKTLTGTTPVAPASGSTVIVEF